jgi:hypothetical protein
LDDLESAALFGGLFGAARDVGEEFGHAGGSVSPVTG